MAGILNIKIDQGCTYKLSVVWKDANKQIVDLTNFTAQIWHTGAEPSTLVVSWFAFTSSELIATAFIKGKKIRKVMFSKSDKY